MVTLNGKSVCGGIAFGKMLFHKRKQHDIGRCSVADPQAEFARFEAAKNEAIAQLGVLYDRALEQVGEENALIFEIHQMMLQDLDYCESIESIITTECVNAEYAVAVASAHFLQLFAAMEDSYMQGRAADVKDVSERLIAVLCGATQEHFAIQTPCIVAAVDLAPSETVQMDTQKILAFVTREGSSNSHTAILARTMNIPAVIGIGTELLEDYHGKEVIVDGFTGTLYVEPDEATILAMQKKLSLVIEQTRRLDGLRGKENVTQDGQAIALRANIGSPADLENVQQNDADGIGLLRSEFLYLERSSYPDEETQLASYRKVVEGMNGKKVVIRTLDIGADKQAEYFHLPHEENPALGMRAIRICLERPEVFKTQLRAIYRASAFGNVAIMFPMISAVWEVLEIKKQAAEVRRELESQGIPFSKTVEIGIMIETPAAAVISDLLAAEVDFFSIGTNDLTQYTLALDRQNEQLVRFFDSHHTAVLRLIKLVTDNAHKNGIPVAICGELAADVTLTQTFLAIGVDALSVAPSRVLEIRRRIRETNVGEIRQEALSALEG